MSGTKHRGDDEEDERIPGVEYYQGIPVFPFVPDSIKEHRFYNIEAGDLPEEADVSELLRRMWEEPNVDFYYFHGHMGGPTADRPILAARQLGMLDMSEMERRYYKHPKFKNDFIRIVPDAEGEFRWDWEEDIVKAGPEYWRTILKLTPRKREEFDAWRKIHLEEQIRLQVQNQRYEYDVFLSYANPDRDEARTLHGRLAEAGLRTFMAEKTLRPGDAFADEIRKALRGSRELWLLVSPSSSKSEWVTTEWGAAWALEKTILPILLRCSHDALPDRLRQIHCLDYHAVGDHILTLVAARSAEIDQRQQG